MAAYHFTPKQIVRNIPLESKGRNFLVEFNGFVHGIRYKSPLLSVYCIQSKKDTILRVLGSTGGEINSLGVKTKGNCLLGDQDFPTFSSSNNSSMAAGVVVVFDFDKTIVDCDSDNWVIDELGATELFNKLLPTMPWNSVMDRMMMELHSQGKTIEDIEEVLQRIPIHPRVVPAIKAAHALGCDLRIVSDANLFFIETILKHLGIRECFSEINTNPAYVNEEGRLKILPYHDFNKTSHGCNLCPPNMCKGLIIDRIQDSIADGENKRFIYLGDGSGDYCPSLRLKEKDIVMPRKNFPVWDLICKNPMLIKAEIHEWSDGEELERVLLQLINKIALKENAQFISSECKLQNMSVSSHEALPQALKVQQ